jgi:hypothetical protein
MATATFGTTLEGTTMIRIDLVDDTTSVKHIDFKKIPITKDTEFRCSPEGVLPLRSIVRLSRELKAGRTSGQSGKFVWYRLIGTPANTYKGVTCGMQ